jgi:vacuolar-type H+-ATPase subunit I/STV1
MTKDQLQKELLKKVKEGIKPSDLKKPRVKNSFDEGYESDSSVKTTQTKTPLKKDQIKQLQAQVKFEANKAQSYLTELQSTLAELDQAQQEIAQLQKRLKTKPETLSQETEQALMEANQKIRQQEQTIKELQKSIAELKNPAKTKEKVKETKTLPPPPEPKQYLFTCDICQQNKRSQLHLSRVNGLGIDPHKLQKICDYCLKKVDIIQERKEEFF